MTKAVVVGVVLSWVVCSAAQAQLPQSPAVDDDLPVESYRLQTLVADGATYAFLLVGTKLSHDVRASEDVWKIGALSFAVATPFVHLAHGRPGRALGSLGLRLVVPFAGALLLEGGDDEGVGAAAGFVLGAVAVSILDTAWLAGGDDPKPAHAGNVLTPTASLVRGGVMVGLGGTL